MYLAERFHDALKNGGRALIAGVAHEQLPMEYRDHPRVICWDSDAPQLTGSRVEIPPRVKAVVLARFLSHSAANQLSRASKRVSAVYFGHVQGTGQIASMLRRAMPVETPLSQLPIQDTMTATQVSASDANIMKSLVLPDPTEFSSMTAAIKYFAKDELLRPLPIGRKRTSPLPHEFYTTLTDKLKEHGYPDAEVAKVTQLFSNTRAQMRKHATILDATEVRVEQVEVQEPMPQRAVEPTAEIPTEPLPPDLDMLVQMAADLDVHAVASLELAEQLRRVVTEQRDLRATKARYDAMVEAMVNITKGAS